VGVKPVRTREQERRARSTFMLLLRLKGLESLGEGLAGLLDLVSLLEHIARRQKDRASLWVARELLGHGQDDVFMAEAQMSRACPSGSAYISMGRVDLLTQSHGLGIVMCLESLLAVAGRILAASAEPPTEHECQPSPNHLRAFSQQSECTCFSPRKKVLP